MAGFVLVTGAGGFIGSHLVESLVREGGRSVKALVHYNSRNDWGWLERSPVREQIEVVTGDIRDYDSVRRCVEGCETVFHLAALIGIPYSYISPIAYIKVNVEGTYNVLRSAIEAECRQVLVTSTSETYGSAQQRSITEDHPLVAQSPYSASKIAADQLALSFNRSFGLPVKVVRPFNTYGPRQSARAFIPTIITQILSGARAIKVGNLTPTRDLTFVTDTVAGFLEIEKAESLVGEVTNIGSNHEISMGDLARLIARLMGKEIEFGVEDLRVRVEKSEVERLRCENQKILSATGWRAKYSLEDGLRETIGWFEDNWRRYKPSLYNV